MFVRAATSRQSTRCAGPCRSLLVRHKASVRPQPELKRHYRRVVVRAERENKLLDWEGTFTLEDLRKQDQSSTFFRLYSYGVWDEFWEDPLDFIDLGSDLTDEEVEERGLEALKLVEKLPRRALKWMENQEIELAQEDELLSNPEGLWSNEKELNEELEAEEILKGLHENFRGQEEIDPYDKLRSITNNWSVWDCRAFAEKKRRKAEEDKEWHKRMSQAGRYKYLNVTDATDLRLYDPEEPNEEWSHDEVMNLIRNNGVNADPAFMLKQEGIEVQNPHGKCDYFLLGIGYQPEAEEYVQQMGMTMTLPVRPPDESSDLTLAEEFTDFEEELP